MPEGTKRHDPPSRPVEGAFTEQGYLRNLDPARVYCLANPNDFETGVAEMLRLQWVTETVRKDGPHVVGGATASDGSVVTYGGSVLMSRPRTAQDSYERSKAEMASQRAKAIGAPGSIDQLKGPTGRLAEWKDDPREYVARD